MGTGGNALIPMAKAGITNLLSEIRMNLFSTSTNPIFSRQHSQESMEQEAKKLSKRDEIQRYLNMAKKSPDLFFESDTDVIRVANEDPDVINSQTVAEKVEVYSGHTITATSLSLVSLIAVMYIFRKRLFF